MGRIRMIRKLSAADQDWIDEMLQARPQHTLDAIMGMAAERGIKISRASLGRYRMHIHGQLAASKVAPHGVVVCILSRASGKTVTLTSDARLEDLLSLLEPYVQQR